MKLLDYILLSTAMALFIMGLDQLFKGFTSYWLFMLSIMCLMLLNYRKFQEKKANTQANIEAKPNPNAKNLKREKSAPKKKK